MLSDTLYIIHVHIIADMGHKRHPNHPHRSTEPLPTQQLNSSRSELKMKVHRICGLTGLFWYCRYALRG
jgi:hypothetical protein